MRSYRICASVQEKEKNSPQMLVPYNNMECYNRNKNTRHESFLRIRLHHVVVGINNVQRDQQNECISLYGILSTECIRHTPCHSIDLVQ